MVFIDKIIAYWNNSKKNISNKDWICLNVLDYGECKTMT